MLFKKLDINSVHTRTNRLVDIVNLHGELSSYIESLESDLKHLRSYKQERDNDWEHDIENDARPSVRLVYGELKRKREELIKFNNIHLKKEAEVDCL